MNPLDVFRWCASSWCSPAMLSSSYYSAPQKIHHIWKCTSNIDLWSSIFGNCRKRIDGIVRWVVLLFHIFSWVLVYLFFVLLNLLVELLFYCCLRNLQLLGFKTEKLELKGMDIGIVHGSSFILFLFFIFHFFIDDED